MAISGTFTADFSSFNTAVQNADVRLKAFEGSSSKVETALSRMTNSFTGQKVISEATLMSEAIERIGGVSKLTESELARVSATAKEAAAKLTAMGQDVPPGIQKIADASTGATSAAFGWKNALMGVAGTLGIAFSVNAIKDFVVNVIQTGASIGDLSQKLGVSTEAVQRWSYAAEQSGATMDNVDKALSTMNRTLSDGSNSTKAILGDIGIRFDDIRKMKPEDAFNTITEAIAGIEDPMLRAEAATKLFGKSGQELLPAIADGFSKVGKEAGVMSEETIRRLKEAEDAWARLKNTVVIHSGEIIAATFRVSTGFLDLMKGLLPGQGDAPVEKALRDITGETDALEGALRRIPPAAAVAIGAGFKPLTMSGADVDATIKHLNISVGNTAASLGMLEPKVGSLDKAIKGFKEHNEAMNIGLRFTSEVVGELPPKLEAVAASLNNVAVAQKAVTASKDAPGSVGINTGGIALGNFDAAFKMFNNIYGSHSNLGMIGGGPTPDFLSWALKNGFATRTVDAGSAPGMFGPSGSAPAGVNVGGVTVQGNVIGTQAELAHLIQQALTEALRGQGARV